MFQAHQLQGNDVQKQITIDSSILAQIDERLGRAFSTREALIEAALQHFIAHIDEAASRDDIHKMTLKPSYEAR